MPPLKTLFVILSQFLPHFKLTEDKLNDILILINIKEINMDALVEAIVNALSDKIPYTFIVALVSMIPILELRGSILAAGLMQAIENNVLNVQFLPTFIAAVIGNMIPIPFILLFIKQIFNWMKKIKFLRAIPIKLEEKVLKKSAQIEKYGYWGLMIFVGIPLPGTGAWTGALLAVLLNLKFKKSLIYIFLGVIMAGLIMSLVSFGIIGSIL